MTNYDPTAALAETLAPKNARAKPLDELGFHQGIVTDFDQDTGANTIMIAGSSIVDVPMLNIGDTTNLASGDNVAVLRYRNAYFVLGRIAIPNAEIFATTSVSFFAAFNTTNTYTITTTETIRATITVPVPIWANRILINAHVNCMGFNSTGAHDAIFASPWIDTINGPQVLQGVLNGTSGSASSAYSRELTVVGGSSFDVTGRTRTNAATWAASGLNRTALNVSAVFRRVTESEVTP